MKTVRTYAGDEFAVGILGKNDDDERLVAREPVTYPDLLAARDETWFRGLRAGLLGPDVHALSMQVLPGESHGADKIEGYTVELRDGRHSYRRHFPLTSLASVARRAALHLIERKVFDKKTDYTFFLTTVRPEADAEPASPPTPADGSRFRHRLAPPAFEPAPLADFLGKSRLLPSVSCPEPEAEKDDGAMPVFVTEDVWQQGRELARRGGENESAAVWTGRLLKDTDSPEIFLRLDACIEAEKATEEKLAVTFSGETWARVREVLDRRRRRLNRPHERLVGSVHGHNFKPSADKNGRRTCDACATAKVCSRTTAAASADDLEWHRAVFTGQPWAVLLVWGYNAREQEDWQLYGLADASLAPRPLRLLQA